MINKTLLQKRFNKAAPAYDAYASVQKLMGDMLIAQLQPYTAKKDLSILELGCGTGYVTEKLVATFPNANVTAVDFAEDMILEAKKRKGVERVTFICHDIETASFSSTYDVIISNATFQWLNALEQTVAHLMEILHEQGILLFTTFGSATFRELHFSFAHATNGERRVGQSFYTRKQLQAMCEKYGASDVSQMYYTEWFPTVRDFLDSVRKIGAANSNAELSSQSPGVFRRMIHLYEEAFAKEGRIPATYEALYSSIIKKGEKEHGKSENRLEVVSK